jgi:putative SOS response-associated peptidase YedK
VPAPAELLTAHPVSPLVNSVRNNGPELTAEATPLRSTLNGGHEKILDA